MSLLILLAAALAVPQSISTDVHKVAISKGQLSAGGWPDWDMTKVGFATYHITYNNGGTAFAAGGSIEVFFAYDLQDEGATNNPNYTGNFDYIVVPNSGTRHSPVDQFQINRPLDPSFTTVSAPVGVRLKLQKRVEDSERVLEITFLSALPLNSDVVITFGDTSHGGPGTLVPWNPGRPKIVALEKVDPSSSYQLSPAPFPTILFTARDFTSFVVNMPPVIRANDPFNFSVCAVQNRDDTPDSSLMTVEDFDGTIRVRCTQAVDHFQLLSDPHQLAFVTSDRGVKLLRGVFVAPGNHALEVDSAAFSTLPSASRSNTAKVLPYSTGDSEYGIYVGDLQRHSCEGGHACIPDWMCWRELHDEGDDFGTVVEHSQLYFSGWQHAMNRAISAQATLDASESSFIAFPGYEYGLEGGHRHVIFKDFTTEPSIADGPYAGGESPGPSLAPTLADFLKLLHHPPLPAIPRIAIIHHSEWHKSTFPNVPYDWGPNQDDGVQRLLEIYSVHGSSEKYVSTPGPSDYVIGHDVSSERPVSEAATAQDALRMGYRFGFIGGSDRHGYSERVDGGDDSSSAYARPGLAFVYGKLSIPVLRERIWSGLTRQHTYATTGARIYMSFSMNGDTIMGDDLATDGPVAFDFDVISAAVAEYGVPDVTDAYIYRDGDAEVFHHAYAPGQKEVVESWIDPNPPNDHALHPYYLKMVQSDDQVAWSSPIWWGLNPIVQTGHK